MPTPKRAAVAAGFGALLLASGAAGATAGKYPSSKVSNATTRLRDFERNYSNAMAFARRKAIENEVRRDPLAPFTPENMKYLEKRAAGRAARLYEVPFAQSVSAKWSVDGVMPQDIFDAVVEKQVPRLGEWDVFAHGHIESTATGSLREFVVPPKTAIVFWNVPGTPTATTKPGSTFEKFEWAHGLQPIPNRKVTVKAKTGNATARPGAYAVMHVGGDRIPDVALTFQDDTLPIGVFTSTTGELAREKILATKLSDFVKVNGPGVYYVLACRTIGNSGIAYDTLQNSIQRTQRARDRQRKYSDPKAFNTFKGMSLLRNVTPESGNWVGSILSGFNVPARIWALCLSAFIPFIVKRGTACIVKGAYVNELQLLIDLATGTGSAKKKIAMYAGKRALDVIQALRKPDVMKQHARRARQLKQLRKDATSALPRVRDRAQKRLGVAMTLRKYGFNTKNRLKLDTLRDMYISHYAQTLNTTAIAEIEAAYAMALRMRNHESIVKSVARTLFHTNRANARKAKIEPGMSRKATQVMKSWGFKDAMTKNAIDQLYTRKKSEYSFMNKIRGRVPHNLTLAYEIAKRRAK